MEGIVMRNLVPLIVFMTSLLSHARSQKPSGSEIVQPVKQIQFQNDQNTFEEYCANFSNNTVDMEFFSPMYPLNYLNGSNCIKIISAGPGEVIRLRFVDHFEMEMEDNCRYDYLEVRDGAFGYSPLIQKVCGNVPPSFIQSSGRHLWLRFHSDQDIQYIGFRAQYEFISSQLSRPELEDCTFHVSDIAGVIESSAISEQIILNRREYGLPIDCTWIVQTEKGRNIYFQFSRFEHFQMEKPNDCTYNYLEVYGSKTELDVPDGRLVQFCSSDTVPITSKSNILHIRFYTMYEASPEKPIKSSFLADYNVFREVSAGQACDSAAEFDCTDNTCVDLSLRCNKVANCKLRNDEDEKCNDKPQFKLSTDILIIAFLGCLLIAGMCSGLFLNVFRKLRQDKMERQELREAMRKSRDSITARSLKQQSTEHDIERDTDDCPIQMSNSHPASQPHSQPQFSHSQDESSSSPSQDTVIEKTRMRWLPQHHKVQIFPSNKKQSTAVPESSPPDEMAPQPRRNNVIPYSPPPPYPSSKPVSVDYGPPRKIAYVGENPSPPKPVITGTPPQIEVRDCGVQTRLDLDYSYTPKTKPKSKTTRRAPLARNEAVEDEDEAEDEDEDNFDEDIAEEYEERRPRRQPMRRIPRSANADVIVSYPSTYETIPESE